MNFYLLNYLKMELSRENLEDYAMRNTINVYERLIGACMVYRIYSINYIALNTV